MKNAIIWFKNDLRLHDNETLVKAIKSGKTLIPVYCFDPIHYRKLEYGFPKADLVRFDFIKQSVENLRQNLKNIGGELMIHSGDTVDFLSAIVEKYDCDEIYTEQEFATEELALLSRLESQLPDTCKLNLTWGRTLYHLNDIPYEITEIPLTSKTFRINTQKSAAVRATFPPPTNINVIELSARIWGKLPTPLNVDLEKKKNYALTYMKGGENEALDRLQYYSYDTEQLTSYRWTRNRSLGLEYSSKFSPYMAVGSLSPRTIYEWVKDYEKDIAKNQSTWWLIFEIVWRDYFTFKLMRFQNAVYQTEGYTDKEHTFTNNHDLFRRWCDGQTGIPFIDAHMRQLNQTGFMSNRGRVNCASFLVHDYLIDWTWGAAYFESKLIDYDVGSNWMNWHTQTYQIWYTNPVNQAHKYKAQEFIRKWVPELRSLNDINILIPWESNLENYPAPHELFKKWNRAINKIKKDADETN